DAMFRLNAFSRDEFLAGIDRFRGMRWVTTLRAIGPYADGRSESPGESVLRLRCIDCDVRVEPQVEVRRDGRVWARIDVANEEQLFGFEYNGTEWHSSEQHVERDRQRGDDLASEGWLLRAFGTEDVFGRARACEAVIRSTAADARRRGPVRIRG
ncbi:MAG TPA: hypothetical protein VD864_08545, partial [Nocardioides sp.]|nr:hypothetical protein [Nocardioides sp.]